MTSDHAHRADHPGSPDTITLQIAIDAPAERVFDALADSSQRIRWWGGEGRFRPTGIESDLRPGGKWVMHFMMGGRPSSVGGEYRTIERPRVLSFTWRPDWYADATETLVRFDLTDDAGVTTVHLTHSGLTTESDRANHGGWPDILNWLRAYAEGNSATPSP
ncbi:MAG TPA: SRPBCC domain-containing protein [Gemmatimonadales bacterium]|jgi:uncharacterized protein YndB with AHSA1/START domain